MPHAPTSSSSRLVVGRLLDMVRPAVALFGEKDYQQLQVVSAMVKLDPNRFEGLTVTGCPTIREPDGLASSRNASGRVGS